MNKSKVYKDVALRPLSATRMLWNHRRTLKYLAGKGRWKNLCNHIFTTYFIRGEDCGKGALDPLWKLSGKAPFLWDIEVEITTRCYLKCIMCEHTYWPDKAYLNQDLKFEDFKGIIDDIPNLHWINLTGEGSAFLNPDFMRMVEYCKKRGLYVDFSHDFCHISEEEMMQLIEWGVDRIYWSFDGVRKETYEKIRVGANLGEVIKNVQRFVKLKKMQKSPLPEVCFRYCFFKDNIDEVMLIPGFLRGLVDDVKDYGDQPSVNIVSLLEFEETKDWATEIAPILVWVTDTRSKLYGFTNYWSHPTHIEKEKPPLDYCTFWSEPYVMITGHVVPCCGTLMSNKRPALEELAFGNIYEESLEKIWNTERYREFRKVVVNPRRKVPRVCLGCRVFNTQDRAKEYGVW